MAPGSTAACTLFDNAQAGEYLDNFNILEVR